MPHKVLDAGLPAAATIRRFFFAALGPRQFTVTVKVAVRQRQRIPAFQHFPSDTLPPL